MFKEKGEYELARIYKKQIKADLTRKKRSIKRKAKKKKKKKTKKLIYLNRK